MVTFMLGRYSVPLLVLSYFISVLGSFAALQLVTGIAEVFMKVDRRKVTVSAGIVGALSSEYLGVVTICISVGGAMALAANHWYRNRPLIPV